MNTFETKQTVVYQYDPLDRLAQTNTLQRFYNSTRIASEIEGSITRSFFEHNAQPLAQQQAGTTTLLATDQQTSVLHSVSTTQSAPHTYTPYGHRPMENDLLSVLGFNGERPDALTGYYLLGQGYRAFNPVLMRFNSTDSLSPFGEGGINTYAYCSADPINKHDPNGHIGRGWGWGWGIVKKALSNGLFRKTEYAYNFHDIKNTPRAVKNIIKLSPGKDLVSLAATNKSLKTIIDTISTPPTELFTVRPKSALVDALMHAAEGNMLGTLPRDAITILNHLKVTQQINVMARTAHMPEIWAQLPGTKVNDRFKRSKLSSYMIRKND